MVIGSGRQYVEVVANPNTGSGSRQNSRTELTQSLQKELKRVGCYSGDVSGEWTPASQQAMNAFLQRLNASLPTNEPDFILLTLVQGQTAMACGAACPSGNVLMENGRCVPAPALAQRSTGAKSTFAERAPSIDSPRGSSVNGAVAATKQPEPIAGWRTTVSPNGGQPAVALAPNTAHVSSSGEDTTSGRRAGNSRFAAGRIGSGQRAIRGQPSPARHSRPHGDRCSARTGRSCRWRSSSSQCAAAEHCGRAGAK